MFNGYYGLTYVSWDLFPSDSKAHLNFDTYGRKTVFSALGYGPVQALRQQHDSIHLQYWTRPETTRVIGLVFRSLHFFKRSLSFQFKVLVTLYLKP